ncbi:MAG TPA: DUF3617 domain-containing protein [Thioalkalivibrio sp.]|nr:DUF3617 domain-containing protein [Thioalkalivibrio sp.]
MKAGLATIMALAIGAFGVPAQAEPEQMRPGLWEFSLTMQSQSGELERAMREMQQQLESMPPEQRQMVERMMAEQGVQMGADSRTMRICISEEQAARGFVPQEDADCEQEVVERSDNTIRVRFTCPGDPPSRGESEITFASPTALRGQSVIYTTVNGKPERMTVEQDGHWLSSDCGNLKAR